MEYLFLGIISGFCLGFSIGTSILFFSSQFKDFTKWEELFEIESHSNFLELIRKTEFVKNNYNSLLDIFLQKYKESKKKIKK